MPDVPGRGLRAKVRLALGRSGPIPAPSRRREERQGAPLEKILGGAWVETEHGPTFVQDHWYTLEHQHGGRPLGVHMEEAAARFSLLLEAKCGWQNPGLHACTHPWRLGFFDLETTGTSGGAGTYIFLAGLGAVIDGSFRLRQYFLAELGQEAAMLSLLLADIRDLEGLVTYNGRTFDVPCLETRATLARLSSKIDKPHLDLLPIVRRLYRHRLERCRLVVAERKLLSFERVDDVPGWLIPSLYFDYIRACRVAPLRDVFRHNCHDILSLVGILGTASLFLTDEKGDHEDQFALGRWWERARRPDRAQPLYQRALSLAEGREAWPRIARQHAHLLKRNGQRREAASLWLRLWTQGDRAAGVELAKYYEHHRRDLGAARDVTRALLKRAPDHERGELEHRLERLERKRKRSERFPPPTARRRVRR